MFTASLRSFVAVSILIIPVVCGAFLDSPDTRAENIEGYYVSGISKLKQELKTFDGLCNQQAPLNELQTQFFKTRLMYKQLAVLTEFFNPYETKLLNAPPLKRVDDDNPNLIIEPHGFQLIEEMLFQKWTPDSYKLLDHELALDIQIMDKMINDPDLQYKFRDETVFEALRRSIVRLVVLDIAGYDSPSLRLSLPGAKATLLSIRDILRFYQLDMEKKDQGTYLELQNLLNEMVQYLSVHENFNSFDRIHFIKKFADPLFMLVTRARQILGIKTPGGKMSLNPDAVSVFSASAFNISYFSLEDQYAVTPERVNLGKKLFFDPILSITGKRSCASCHKPELAFTDGLKTPMAIDGKTVLKRNTPTLWNTVFQTNQFFDSRTDFLENQLDDVVHNTDEMNGSLKQTVKDIKNHPLYSKLFQQAYADQKDPITPFNIANAVSSYVRSLVAMNSRFDQFMRGDESRLSMQEQSGFNLFTGKARCATCHFIPLFNGLLPPEYEETESEIIGVPKSAGKKALDEDAGKFNSTRSEIDRYSFKTPTLRNIELTAPYMHNGAFRTLRQVIDFYNKGGGKGLKIAPPNQTLPFDKLGLTAKERNDILAFLKSLTDTSYTYSR